MNSIQKKLYYGLKSIRRDFFRPKRQKERFLIQKDKKHKLKVCKFKIDYPGKKS